MPQGLRRPVETLGNVKIQNKQSIPLEENLSNTFCILRLKLEIEQRSQLEAKVQAAEEQLHSVKSLLSRTQALLLNERSNSQQLALHIDILRVQNERTIQFHSYKSYKFSFPTTETARDGQREAGPDALPQRTTPSQPVPRRSHAQAADPQDGPYDEEANSYPDGREILDESGMGQGSAMLGQGSQEPTAQVRPLFLSFLTCGIHINYSDSFISRVQRLQEQLLLANEQRVLQGQSRIGDFLSGKPTSGRNEDYENIIPEDWCQTHDQGRTAHCSAQAMKRLQVKLVSRRFFFIAPDDCLIISCRGKWKSCNSNPSHIRGSASLWRTQSRSSRTM